MSTQKNQNTIAILIDSQNVCLDEKSLSILLKFAHLREKIVTVNYYFNSILSEENNKKQQLEKLEFLGVKIEFIDVPCPLKNSADNQLKSDFLDLINSSIPPNQIILVSGDGDFASVVTTASNKYKIQVTIIANKGKIKKKLTEIAPYYFIEDLEKEILEINNLNSFKEIESKTMISYAEAVKYLMKSIQLCIKQKKSTSLNYIEGLMRKECPNYQGCSSILRPDEAGKTFSKWSKFIEMVANDGKIKLEKQQLLLVI
jgi:hypothetical protein